MGGVEVVIRSIEGAGVMADATEAYLYDDGVRQRARGSARWHPGHRRIRGGIVLDMSESNKSAEDFGGQQRGSRLGFSFLRPTLSLTNNLTSNSPQTLE